MVKHPFLNQYLHTLPCGTSCSSNFHTLPYGAWCSANIIHCLVEPHDLAKPFSFIFPRGASCSGKHHAFLCGASWSGKFLALPCGALWSSNLMHFPMEFHTLETFILFPCGTSCSSKPLCRSWSLDLVKILPLCISHTIYWSTLHIIWFRYTYHMVLNNTLLVQTIFSPHPSNIFLIFQVFYTSKNFLSFFFNSNNSFFFFYHTNISRTTLLFRKELLWSVS